MKLKEKFYRCENCGAEICFSSTSNVSSCIYCNSSVVYIDKDIANLNVKKIIPFEISIDEVQNNLDYYLKSSSKSFLSLRVLNNCMFQFVLENLMFIILLNQNIW